MPKFPRRYEPTEHADKKLSKPMNHDVVLQVFKNRIFTPSLHAHHNTKWQCAP